MSALRELIAFFGMQVDDKPLDHAEKRIEGFKKTLEKAAATIGIAFGVHEISEFVHKQIEMGNEALNTAEMLGVAVDELKEFRYAAYQADVSAEEADNALRFLNKNLGEAAIGAGSAGQAFQRLGVKIKDETGATRPAVDVLEDIADAFEKNEDPAKATATAMELFGRAGARMIPLLNKGSKGIAELRREFKELNAGAAGPSAEVLEEAEHQMKRNEVAVRGLKAVFAAELIPVFTSFISWVTTLVLRFREFASHSYIVQTALGTLAAVSAVLLGMWAVMNIEVLLVVAAIALLVLIVDDIYTAFKGGKSVIGDFIDSIFGIGTTKAIFDNLKEWAHDAVSFVAKAIAAVAVLIDGVKGAWNWTKHALGALDDQEYAAAEAARQKELQEDMDTFDRLDHPVRQATSFAFGPEENVEGAKVRRAKTMTFGAPAAAAAPATAQVPASQVTHQGDVHKNTEVNVQVTGVKDPDDTGKKVQAAVLQAIKEDENQASYAALGSGGGH